MESTENGGKEDSDEGEKGRWRRKETEESGDYIPPHIHFCSSDAGVIERPT